MTGQQCPHGQTAFSPDGTADPWTAMGAAARAHASLGDAVIPLGRKSKRPHAMLRGLAPPGQGGAHLGRSDPAWTGWCWRDQDPLAGVGAVTGSLPPAAGQRRVMVTIDLDVKGIADGRVTFAQFLAENGLQLPACPVSDTPSGGQHLWLSAPAGTNVPGRTGILPGVDVKGKGGYAVVPPTVISLHFGERPGDRGTGSVLLEYKWQRGCPCEIPLAPRWVFEWLASAPAPRPAGNGHGGDGSLPGLAELLQTGIPPGERNDMLHKLACSLYRKRGSSSPDVIANLRAVWEAGDTAGMPWREVEKLAAYARQWVAGQEQADQEAMAYWMAVLPQISPGRPR